MCGLWGAHCMRCAHLFMHSMQGQKSSFSLEFWGMTHHIFLICIQINSGNCAKACLKKIHKKDSQLRVFLACHLFKFMQKEYCRHSSIQMNLVQISFRKSVWLIRIASVLKIHKLIKFWIYFIRKINLLNAKYVWRTLFLVTCWELIILQLFIESFGILWRVAKIK